MFGCRFVVGFSVYGGWCVEYLRFWVWFDGGFRIVVMYLIIVMCLRWRLLTLLWVGYYELLLLCVCLCFV